MQTLVLYWLFRTSPKREPRSTKHLTFGSLFDMAGSKVPIFHMTIFGIPLPCLILTEGASRSCGYFSYGSHGLVKNYYHHLLSNRIFLNLGNPKIIEIWGFFVIILWGSPILSDWKLRYLSQYHSLSHKQLHVGWFRPGGKIPLFLKLEIMFKLPAIQYLIIYGWGPVRLTHNLPYFPQKIAKILHSRPPLADGPPVLRPTCQAFARASRSAELKRLQVTYWTWSGAQLGKSTARMGKTLKNLVCFNPSQTEHLKSWENHGKSTRIPN